MSTIKLNRTTLAEQVAIALVQRIAHERLKPGDSLPSISALADQFSVSKPIIREALKTLEGRELIIMSNGRTPIIKHITSDSLRSFFERAVALDPKSLIELLEIRRGLEIQSVILAAHNREPSEIREMQILVSAMREKLHNPVEYTELDIKLHLLIASASHNALMLHLVQSIRDVLKDTIKEGLRIRFTEEQIQRVQTLHEMIVAEIADSNAQGATAAMAAHFDDAINAIYQTMLNTENKALSGVE